MIRYCVSGGQSGVDQSALRAATMAAIPTGGWMPTIVERGRTIEWATEDGPRPEFGRLYDMVLCRAIGYPERTHRNVGAAEATIWIGPVGDGAGFGCTQRAARALDRPLLHCDAGRPIQNARQLADEIRRHGWGSLNLAGSRESKQPGIGARTERFLAVVFRLLKETG